MTSSQRILFKLDKKSLFGKRKISQENVGEEERKENHQEIKINTIFYIFFYPVLPILLIQNY